MSKIRLAFASAMLCGVWLGYQPSAQEAPARPDYESDLRARHPEIVEHPDFRRWLERLDVGPWYESEADPRTARQTVIVQNLRGDQVFAAQISGVEKRSIERTALIDLAAEGLTRAEALDIARADKLPMDQLRANRPVVEFLPKGTWTVTWEFDVLSGTRLDTYRLKDKDLQKTISRDLLIKKGGLPEGALSRGGKPIVRPMAAPAKPTPVPDPEWLAADDLHHLPDFHADATAMTKGLTSTEDRARRITSEIFRRYRYDATIPDIDDFTWSDLSVLAIGRRGVCDEFAVVATTHLRALGIPARIKHLVWVKANGSEAGHSIVEYQDGSSWRHLDPTWNKFHEPSTYRASGATQVSVMDADHPSDARSNHDAWGKPDVLGDGKLHPYFDFVITPAYPGNSRPGYSH